MAFLIADNFAAVIEFYSFKPFTSTLNWTKTLAMG